MTQATVQQTIPTAIAKQLRALRWSLRNWILVRGVSRWLVIALAILAVDMVLDRFFKMDFAQRLIMLCVMAAAIAAIFIWRVVKPLMGQAGDDALLLEIETKHPELNESLISSAQLSRQADFEKRGVSAELAEATIHRGVDYAGKLDFGKTLNRSQHFKNLLLLTTGSAVTVLVCLGIFQTAFLHTWFNRNILLLNDPWPQRTYLEIAGTENGRLVLPRGADHRQLVHVTQDSKVRDVEVAFEIEGPNGRTSHKMKPTGKLDGREHVFVMHNLSSEVRIRASGGDDTTDWIQVELVEPPAVVTTEMKAVLPDYTGMPPVPLLGAGPHSVLVGSQLRVSTNVNKPLSKCELRLDNHSFELKPNPNDELQYAIDLPVGGGQLQGGLYEFSLTDRTGLANTRATKFMVKIKEDAPPKVRASLLGISGLVVPRAMVPVSYSAQDEYGVTTLFFDCNWKEEDSEENQPPRNQVVPIAGIQQGQTNVREVSDVGVLDLIPLNLGPGASFRLTVNATDNRPNTPNSARSTEFLLRIVTEEELRADLLRREKEQRNAFQQAYDQQLELMTELQAVEAMTLDGLTTEKFGIERTNRLISLSRDQKVIGTNVDAVANRFEEFLVEVKNNRLDEDEKQFGGQTIETRFDQGIIQPIRAMDAELISMASRNLDNCRRVIESPDELRDAVDKTVAVQQLVLEEMKRILSAMADSEDFQAIVNDVLEIKRGENQIRSEIEKRNKPDKDIFDEDEIFDDGK